MTSIEGDAALAEFRAGLTGRRGLDLLAEHGGRVLVQLPVGVGKSRMMDEVTLAALEGGDHDLVVVLAPTRRLIEERRPLLDPPPGRKVVDLRPRPAEDCGPARDAAWRRHERADRGALGRVDICSACLLASSCFWPEQYARGLEGAEIVYATHAHLGRSPGFLAMIQDRTGAERPLTLIDEFDFAGKDFGHSLSAEDLARFEEAMVEASPACGDPAWGHARWIELVEMLRGAWTVDLQESGWEMPPVHKWWAYAVQKAGVGLHGDDSRFLAYRLADLGRSPIETRRKGPAGEIEYAISPSVGDALIFTATAGSEFARHRLREDLGSPFAGHRFRHPGTTWHNIASKIGASRYFPGNADRILEFFGTLVARRASEGRRVLLISKKVHIPLCRKILTDRFARLGAGLEVLGDEPSEADLARPGAVPLINYGTIGTNLYEGFDCAYCLNSYYINEDILDHCLQDLTRVDLRLPTKIETLGSPCRRRAGVADPAHRGYDVASLAQPTLEYKEHGVVVQAVGRVRPFTTPCEVITFQMAELPGVLYDAEHETLEGARRAFDIPTRRERQGTELDARIRELRDGFTQSQTAKILGISEKTVRNYETKAREDRKKSIYNT